MKHERWENKDYLKFISEMPCANCHLKDGTVVAHHLKGRFSPLSGGAGVKASDIFAMPYAMSATPRYTLETQVFWTGNTSLSYKHLTRLSSMV